MITKLTIKNYALIENLEMTPSQSLNVITGETGAGKSIMLGALGLLLGKRADSKALFDVNNKCSIEAKLDVKNYKLIEFFEKNDLDYDDECIIRREIATSGKSRAFINDTPVTLDTLKLLGSKLVDIHSQNETLSLADSNFQLGVVDQYANSTGLRREYKNVYTNYKKAEIALEKLLSNEAELKKEFDFNSFQLNELIEANLEDINWEDLQSQLEVLENAGDIKQKFAQASQILDESEFSINQSLGTLLAELKQIKDFSSAYNDIYERFYSSYLELDDLNKEIKSLDDKIEINEEEMLLMREKIDLVQRLLQKHQVNEPAELLKVQEDLQKKVSHVENLDSAIQKAKEETENLFKQTTALGKKLSSKRGMSFKTFETELTQLLSQLGMSESKVQVAQKETAPGPNGIDSISILFSANKGIEPQVLKNVASGGEFSRLMFCLKYILADKTALPTMIFDEIDTGVSGEIALKMIQMMKKMASDHQVISISHLPQFAAGGDSHYFVYKDNSSDRSISKIKKLDAEERINSIAKMISGENVTSSALESAKELLSSN